MIRSIFLTIFLSAIPISVLWAQDDRQGSVTPRISKPIIDFGLIYEDSIRKVSPDSMPILNPKGNDAKIRQWSPPFKWFNSMPVIGGPEEKADSLNYWWLQDLTPKKSDQHK